MTENLPIYTVVLLFPNPDSEQSEQQYLINLAHRGTRDWFLKFTHFAMTNNKSVEINRASADDMINMHVFVPKEKEREAA